MAIGFSNGVITLDEQRCVYYSGQVISGSIQFELDQPINYSVLTITYVGQASVLWTEEQREEYNGVVRHSLVKYIGQEEYFNYTEYLAGGRGISQLPAGPQTFNFKFRIPSSAPSTFNGEKGGVKYSITSCLVNTEPLSPNEVIAKEFEVVSPINLNTADPILKQPIQLEFEEIFDCNCTCNADPMTVRVKLPVSGYCPGQVIPIGVEAENDTNTEIHKIVFQLVSKESYRSQQPVAEYIPPEKVLAVVKKGPVMGKTRRNFTCDLRVPEMVAPNLNNCSIIDVKYYVRITVKLSGCKDDLTDESEIFLGFVPLSNFTKGDYIHPMTHSLPTGPLPDPNTPYIPVHNPINSFVEQGNNQPQSYPQVNYPPPPYPGQNGTNSHQNAPYTIHNATYPSQTSPYPAQNGPYPGTSPYPSEHGNNLPKSQPIREIGFKPPEIIDVPRNDNVSNPPYPLTNNMPGATPPYPMPLHPGKDLRIHLPPIPGRAQPSAPPPSS